MYEEKTTKRIHDEMLGDVSDKYDKSVGSFIYDATKPPAIQLKKAYEAMGGVIDKFDVENLFDDELERFINQRTGIERRQATYAYGELLVEGNGVIREGDLFETESGVQFEATETVTITGSGTVPIRSLLPGDIGNVPANQINHMPVTIGGINAIINPEPTTEGYEQETDEELRTRYYTHIRTPATSGNKYHYLSWALEVPGVGKARVFPLWQGDNTVKVVIIDSNMQPASDALVEEVQEHIDPGITGLGDGEAPIGAFATVVSATRLPIELSLSIVKEDSYSEETVISSISSSVEEYLQEIAFEQDYVSYAHIGRLILESDGVVDYENLTVNGTTDNIDIGEEEIAVLGGVTFA